MKLFNFESWKLKIYHARSSMDRDSNNYCNWNVKIRHGRSCHLCSEVIKYKISILPPFYSIKPSTSFYFSYHDILLSFLLGHYNLKNVPNYLVDFLKYNNVIIINKWMKVHCYFLHVTIVLILSVIRRIDCRQGLFWQGIKEAYANYFFIFIFVL